MPTDWSKDSIYPGVFDGFDFDEIVFDCFFTEVAQDSVTGDWTKGSLTTGSWTPESSTT